jgi:hypothetical protein
MSRQVRGSAGTLALGLGFIAFLACRGPAGPAGNDGTNGANGTNGTDGTNGKDGQNAATTGTIVITAIEEAPGDAGTTPMAGVAVSTTTLEGSAVSGAGVVAAGTTDATGTATLTLPFGVYDLTLSKAGYTSPHPLEIGVVALQNVAISVALSEASSSKPTLVLVAAGTEIGFGNTTTVTATGTSPLGETLSYAWTNTTAGSRGGVTGSGTSGSITTPTLQAAMAPLPDPAATGWNLGNFVSGYTIPNTFGVFPILNDTNGATTATVTATDPYGMSSTASVTVTAGSFQNGTQAAAIGTRVFLNAGGPLDGGSWTLASPSGSSATLDSATSQFPSFIPDVAGAYVATLGANSLTLYAGSWVGAIAVPGSTPTPTPWAFLPDGGPAPIPFAASENCTLCHNSGPTGVALDMFTPWIGTKHAVHMTYGMDGVAGFASGQSCLGCHSAGFDPGNQNPLAGGLSQVAAANHWTYPTTVSSGNWAAVPPPVAQLANIQCENCHGPNGNGSGGSSAGHMLTRLPNGTLVPFQSPRISYASEDCATCHAAGTGHHHYSEWATLNPDNGRGHSNLAVAQSEGLTTVGAQTGLNPSCARCHSAQGFTEYAGNLAAGNVGSLSPTQQAVGQVNKNNIQPQTCQTCHDPHQDALDPNTGEDEHQLRVWDSTGLLPSGFAVAGAGSGAICITCHNSRNGAYNASPATNATTTAYLHEDSDWIGSNPGSSNAALVARGYAGLGAAFSSLGGPHEADQGDVFTGHNAYFLTDQTPVFSPHFAVKNTCAGCHMNNNPQSYSSHGSLTTATHLFAITDAAVPALCSKCHGNGSPVVDDQAIKASVVAGLQNVVNNMSAAVLARVNDASGAVAPAGYGAWTDTGTIIIAKGALTDTTQGCTPATDPSCGLSNTAPVTIVTAGAADAGLNPAISAVATPQGRSGITVVLTFASPVSVTFASGVTQLSSFTVNLGKLDDAAGNPLFAANGNIFKANWNYALISQDGSWGVHNPPFVSAVLSATAAPWGNPNATPPQPGGLKY